MFQHSLFNDETPTPTLKSSSNYRERLLKLLSKTTH